MPSGEQEAFLHGAARHTASPLLLTACGRRLACCMQSHEWGLQRPTQQACTQLSRRLGPRAPPSPTHPVPDLSLEAQNSAVTRAR